MQIHYLLLHHLRKWICARLTICFGCACALLATAPATAFQILPKVSDVDRQLAGLGNNRLRDPLGQFAMGGLLPRVKNPVHEAITLAALGCSSAAAREKECLTLEAIAANRVLLYGVRWPDDPPFKLNSQSPPRLAACDARVTLRSTAQPQCWLGLFNDAGVTARTTQKMRPGEPAFGPGDYLLYRSHYGDLQFFHAMATYDGELAASTQSRMRSWAEFLWGIATGKVPTNRYIRQLGYDDMAAHFPGDITVTNLLAMGIVEVRPQLDKVALGALLHMVQDSFSTAHAAREPEPGGTCEEAPRFAKPGRIVQFYSYAQQDGSLHDHEDTFDALGIQTVESLPSVVQVSRDLLTLWNEQASWDEAGRYLNCVMELQDGRTPAGPGRFVLPPPAAPGVQPG